MLSFHFLVRPLFRFESLSIRQISLNSLELSCILLERKNGIEIYWQRKNKRKCVISQKNGPIVMKFEYVMQSALIYIASKLLCYACVLGLARPYVCSACQANFDRLKMSSIRSYEIRSKNKARTFSFLCFSILIFPTHIQWESLQSHACVYTVH